MQISTVIFIKFEIVYFDHILFDLLRFHFEFDQKMKNLKHSGKLWKMHCTTVMRFEQYPQY